MFMRNLNILILALGLISASIVKGQSYKIAHCYGGCPLGGSTDNHLIIRPIYALSYNTTTKSANWVSYKVSPESIGIASSLSRVPIPDEFVEDTLTAIDFSDAESLGFIRALYVPLVDFAGTPYWNEVNYLTNSVARTSSLSQGAWYGLDWSIRNLVNRKGAVHVITGPVFDTTGEGKSLFTSTSHRIPDSFFKIVITKDGDAAAFLMSQDSPVYLHHCQMQSSITQIEALTHLDLFPLVLRSMEESLYGDLGCV